jgi:hypothetical protein
MNRPGDIKIKAHMLRKGMKIHLTVMGGDEYFEITRRMAFKNRIRWWATGVDDISDTCSRDQYVWIKDD